MDLNEDIQLEILEHLDFEGLRSFARTNTYFSLLAVEIFKKQYSKKLVEIKSANAYLSWATNQHQYGDDQNTIYLRDAKSAEQILKNFGQSIRRMKINYDESVGLEESAMETMSKSINLYCSDTLTDIIIYDSYQKFFSQITRPFKSVENVELYGHFESLNSETHSFNEIFPSMKNLFLSSTKIEQNDQIFRHFPNLVEFGVRFYNFRHKRNVEESDIEQVFEMNPQIQRLKLETPTEYILRVASTVLPNLKYLRIESTPHRQTTNTGATILFKNVKTLELRIPSKNMLVDQFLEGIEFEHLKELRAIVLAEAQFDWWVNFITRTPHLKKFESIEGCINDVGIQKFTKMRNHHLNDISIALCVNVEVKSIVNFVHENQGVDRFHLRYDKNNGANFEETLSALRERLNESWTIRNKTDLIELEKH